MILTLTFDDRLSGTDFLGATHAGSAICGPAAHSQRVDREMETDAQKPYINTLMCVSGTLVRTLVPPSISILPLEPCVEPQHWGAGGGGVVRGVRMLCLEQV